MQQHALDGKRIFIVEDDISNMAVYAVSLRQKGAVVVQDHWNHRTIDLLKLHSPIDIILLDLMLRDGVSGYDIFEKIKQNENFIDIPIVAVSASDPEIEIPKTKLAGFNGFISKPIKLQEFPNQIAACIAGERLWLNQSYETY